jgi:sugar lactone lactonase YvrE
MPSSGGQLRRLGAEAHGLSFPSWSPDGKSIFASLGNAIDGREETEWEGSVRVDITDGRVTRIQSGGIWPHPSSDGKFLYYFSSRYSELRRVPTTGGAVEQLVNKENYQWYVWAVGKKFIYLVEEQRRSQGPPARTLVRWDPDTRAAQAVAPLPFAPAHLQVTPDERYLYIESKDESFKTRIVVVRGIF